MDLEAVKALSGTAVVFDLDGTLVDSAPDIGRVLNDILVENDHAPLPLSEIRNMVGRGARHLLERGFAASGDRLDAVRSDTLLSQFITLYEADIARDSQVFPGAMEALTRLREQGCRLAVCTNKYEHLAMKLLTALELTPWFETVVGGDTLKTKKPDAAPLLHALGAIPPERAVMVGDAAPDIGAARAAGVPVIAVGFGYTETPAGELGADEVIHDYDALYGAVAALLRVKTYRNFPA